MYAIRGILIVSLLWSGMVAPAGGEQRLTFIGVALDRETRDADRALQDYLRRKAGVSLAPEELEYGRVIELLANWQAEDGHFLARMTPYVAVAAEMLGARFETLATYVSTTTSSRTYHSYLVVNRRHFPAQPTLHEVLRFLTDRPQRARFVYHRQLSTSSYFLPSLVFRQNRLYHMAESTESLVAIACDKIADNSSSRLVELVAAGEAEVAAVWDGTKSKFEVGSGAAIGSQVYFVQLPTSLPNDLLVCSATLDDPVKARLREAIAAMATDEIDIGDFLTWHTISEATDARLALASLRWSARERVAPVTVDVRVSSSHEPKRLPPLDAVRQAVRLSGTELVLYDEDFHEHIDVVLEVGLIHDGAVLVRSSIPGSEIADQEFQLSFRDDDDLARRVVSLIWERMHRIRYVWPYSGNPPVVIRDIAFSLPAGAPIKVQRISWLDPERNSFRAGPLVDSRVVDSGFYRWQLNAKDLFSAGDGGAGDERGLDAMSNVSYRVYLLRSSEESLALRVLTISLMVLLVLAAILALLRLRRSPGSEINTASLVQTEHT